MTTSDITRIGKDMLIMTMYLGGPIVIIGMAASLIVSVLQTATQIQEQSVGFVIKIVASAAALLFFAPWMLQKTIDFTSGFLGNLDKFVR